MPGLVPLRRRQTLRLQSPVPFEFFKLMILEASNCDVQLDELGVTTAETASGSVADPGVFTIVLQRSAAALA